MRVHSREVFVGFLLVLGLVAGACQPVHLDSEVSSDSATIVESQPISESATLVESSVISESVVVSDSLPITTDAMTATMEISATSGVSEGAEISDTIAVSATAVMSASVPSADPATLAAGLAVYRAQYCGVCHTLSAAETRGTFGPPHDGLGATAAERITDPTYHGKATTAAEYIHESIVDPQAFGVPGYATTSHRMPSYAHLDAASLDALIAFLLAQ